MSEGNGNNPFKPKEVKAFVKRVETIKDEIASEKGAFMKRCAELNGDIKAVLDEAKDSGIPKKELKAVIKARDLERRAEAVREDLDETEQQDNYDLIRQALGDLAGTPLGEAATR